jgi:putative Mn2+ efflux pump MntP
LFKAIHGVSAICRNAGYGSPYPAFIFIKNILEESEMGLGFGFFFTNIMLGVGLAMDAFSVALANGLNEPTMRKRKMCGIAGMFSFFQALMPLIGWVCVHTIVQYFGAFEAMIPWIALLLLCFIGGKMLYEGIFDKDDDPAHHHGVTFLGLVVQGIATSIDAFSVGFTIADYNGADALLAAALIAAVTFIICMGGLLIGRKAGTKLAGKAGIFGGAILIFIGLEIFFTGIF